MFFLGNTLIVVQVHTYCDYLKCRNDNQSMGTTGQLLKISWRFGHSVTSWEGTEISKNSKAKIELGRIVIRYVCILSTRIIFVYL